MSMFFFQFKSILKEGTTVKRELDGIDFLFQSKLITLFSNKLLKGEKTSLHPNKGLLNNKAV